jgi:sulfur-carrier protein adenylyltransferase/sulfurtransferase
MNTDQTFSPKELARYGRHLALPGFGQEGQRKLKSARMLIIGVGGLGSPAALYLAAAGVGTLGLVDDDHVDESNLQRQIIHGTQDIGLSKLDSATRRIADLNPHVTIIPHEVMINEDNAQTILSSYDMILDCTDNFAARYLVNDACVLLKKPYVYGSVFNFEGQVTVFCADHGPCYRCLHPEPPPEGTVPDCATGGVLGVLPGLIGTMQAVEAIKLATGIGAPLIGRMVWVHALTMTFQTLILSADPECMLCGRNPTLHEIRAIRTPSCETSISKRIGPEHECSVETLAAMLAQEQDLILLDVREAYELVICSLPGITHIPLAELPARLDELDKNAPIVALCRTGPRSEHATRFLLDAGFKHVRNLVGGMRAWAERIDPSMPKY